MSSSDSSDSDDEIHSDDNAEAVGAFNNNTGHDQNRKGRGLDKPTWGKSGKEYIEFTKDGLCVVPKDAKLSRYLGSLARTYSLLPLAPKDWRLHKEDKRNHVWKTISDTIDWRPEDIPNIPIIRHVLLRRLSKRCRNNKAALKRLYYTPYIGTPLRFTCKDDRVDKDQWQAMVHYWDTDDKNKIKSEKNIESRKKLKISHTGGTKSFVRHLAEFEKKKGRAPDPIEAFDLLHKRKDEENSWVDDASEQTATKITQELNQLVATHGEETPELRLQAYITVRCFETGGRVRGYGEAVTPNMVPWVVQTQPTSSSRRSCKGRDYACLESQFLELQANYERQQENFDRQQAINEQQQKQIEELRQMVLSSQQQPSHPPSQRSPSQPRSPSQQRSSSQQRLSSQQQSCSQQHSPFEQAPSSHQYPFYAQHPPYRYPSSSQLYYPQPYQPPLYPPMPYPHGEYTGLLNDPDFLQNFMPPDSRSRNPDGA